MKRKNILVDLSILRHPYCGLGQIALNYGRWFSQAALPDGCRITLLVPKAFKGAFGQGVDYLVYHDIYRSCPWLMPSFDTWHAIHQLSRFRPWSKRTRYLLTIHDVNFLHEKTAHKQQRYAGKLQRKCDRADAICFISNFAREDASRILNLDGKPLHVIYNGVEDLTQGPQTKPTAVEAGQPFFLTLGEVKEKKNIHTLLPLMERFPTHRLLVAGNDGTPYAADLRAQLGRYPNVQMLGLVSDEERRWLYSHCTALLFPSVSEGFGLPAIEAMQWGKPVFCSDRTSLPEIGSSHAYYFTDFDPERMASVVKHGLADFADPQKAIDEQRYAASFSYERHMQAYMKLYLNR
ncbi:MAG: glycosyltransferase family 4 protein [Bacteroidales bacterium]|nr:glycosyltransferase family 4 protein [Bacteroidales bacterium]